MNHIKEGIRRELQSRTNPIHEHFIKQIEYLFRQPSVYEYSKYARKLLREHNSNPIYQNILKDLNKKHELLIRHLIDRRAPATNNLMESFNSHLEARVRSLKGFESFTSAQLWLNAYVMNRRLTKFSDCRGKFKYLNKTVPISHTAMWDSPKVSLLKEVTTNIRNKKLKTPNDKRIIKKFCKGYIKNRSHSTDKNGTVSYCP